MEAQQAAVSLLNRHQVTQQEVMVLQQKLKSTCTKKSRIIKEKEKKAAVAEAKFEVMQSFHGHMYQRHSKLFSRLLNS